MADSHPPDETGIHKRTACGTSLTSSHPPVRNGHPRKDVGKLDEQSSACTKRASTKRQHVGKLTNSHPFFKWEKQLVQLTGLLRYWQTAREEDWRVVTVGVGK